MNKIVVSIFSLVMAAGVTLPGMSFAMPLAGLLTVDQGIKSPQIYINPATGVCVPDAVDASQCALIDQYESGSYFAMQQFQPVTAYVIGPGTAGGIVLGSYQNFVLNPDEPHPAGHPDAPNGAGSGYSGAVPVTESTAMAPFVFSINTYIGINPIGYQSGDSHAAPSADVDLNDCVGSVCSMTADLSAWEVFWNGSAFEQGPRPDNTGDFVLATGSYDLTTRAYSLDWTSQIKGGPFNGVLGIWHLEGAHVIPVPAALWLFGSGLCALFAYARRRS